MTDEYLFIETLSDLKNKVNGSNYDHLRACGLLRHLLLDNPNLLSLANKKYKIKPFFHVADYISKPPLEPYILFSCLEPISKQTYSLRVDQFLAVPFLKYGQHEYTVRDIIRVTSHKFGGIHSYAADIEKDIALKDFDEVVLNLTNMQLDIFYRSINSIAIVTITALEPLESIINKSIAADGFEP